MAPAPDRPNARPLLDRVEALLIALEQQGFRIDVEQRARLTELLMGSVARGSVPETAEALSNLVTPILAGTPSEQEACALACKLVAGDQADLFTKPGRRDTSNPPVEARGWSLGIQSKVARLLVAVLLLGIAAIVGFSILIPDEFVRSAEKGVTGILHPSDDVALLRKRSLNKWIEQYPIEKIEPPGQAPWNRTLRWFYVEYDVSKWLAVLLPCAVYLAFLAYLYHRLVVYLRREALRQNLQKLSWHLHDVDVQFGDRQLINRLQPLRKLAHAHVRILDPERTVQSSAEAAGLLRPRFREVGLATNFVIYVDRQSARDHLAAYSMEVVRILRDVGLSIEIFEFNRDPSLCLYVRQAEFVSFDAAIRRFPESVHLIFASADQLFDPVRDRVLPSAHALRDARRAVLLVPRDTEPERFYEIAAAEQLHLIVIPTTPEGLGRLVSILLEDVGKGDVGLERRRVPVGNMPAIDFLEERPGRWLQTTAPSPRHQRLLVERLRKMLGAPLFRFLAATTVYPELRWPLTLLLRSRILEPRHRNVALDTNILTLSRLPWFRAGWMPDWLRDLLQRQLSAGDRSSIQHEIAKAIGTVHDERNPGAEEMSAGMAGAGSQGRVKTDSIMLAYLLPIFPAFSRYFVLPRSMFGKYARNSLRTLTRSAVAGAIVAPVVSAVLLSLLPIDQCDLLASSDMDDYRIGPGRPATLLETFYADEAIQACQNAVSRSPMHGRHLFQFGRALSGSKPHDAFNHVQQAAELVPPYPAALDWIGAALVDGMGVERNAEEALKRLRTASSLGNVSSEYNVGRALVQLNRREEALKTQKKYVEAGGKYTTELASFLKPDSFHGSRADFEDYVRVLELGKSRGDGEAANQLGDYYKDVLRDKTRRINDLFELSIRLSANEQAAGTLAWLYMRRNASVLSYEKDMERATYWAIFAAKQGNKLGMDVLNDLLTYYRTAVFRSGYGPPQDFKPSEIIRELAESGGKDSYQTGKYQYLWGSILEGENKKDEAVAWYEKALKNGSWRAEEALKVIRPEENARKAAEAKEAADKVAADKAEEKASKQREVRPGK